MKKLVVWDLFGGGQHSVRNALKDESIFDIYTFDITQPLDDHCISVNLGNVNKVLSVIKERNIPNPDIIVASPLCQSFSAILSMKNGGTAGWDIKNGKMTIRDYESFALNANKFILKSSYKHYAQCAQLGGDCLYTTMKLIDMYKPKCWYIENPKNSLIWRLLGQLYTDYKLLNDYRTMDIWMNDTYYGNYGDLMPKPTTFCSNMNLELNETNPGSFWIKDKTTKRQWHKDFPQFTFTISERLPGPLLRKKLGEQVYNLKLDPKFKNAENINDYQIGEAGPRSHIPPKLIQAIFKKFLDKLTPVSDLFLLG